MVNISIDSVSEKKVQFGSLITIQSGKNKYSFFTTKKNGEHTKAYQQFNQYGFKVGQTVQAEVKEEKITISEGQNKGNFFTRRTILYFNEIENAPVIIQEGLPENTENITAEDLPF